MYSPVKIGLVGAGNFGLVHAHTINGLVEADLVAVVDSHRKALASVSSLFPGVLVWEKLEEAIAESDADAWIVATSTASHVAVARALLEAGKTILVEKPIALDVADAESLGSLVAADSGNFMMGHVALFNSEFRQLSKEVAQRGAIEFIDCARHRPVSTLRDYPGESPFYLTMVHDLYLVAALKPDTNPVHLSAQSRSGKSGECDVALAQLKWDDGTIASFTASFRTPEGMASDGFDRIEVFGDGWVARVSANPRPMELWDDKARWPMALEIGADAGVATGMLAEQLRCFCRVVRREGNVPAGARYSDAVRVQRWLEILSREALC